MTTYKEKAEAYVRQQLPELMELSFGCKILKFEREMTFIDLTSYDNGSHTLTFRAPNGTVHNGTYYTSEIEEIKIIGHPIQLQHWLRVLGRDDIDMGDYLWSEEYLTFVDDEGGDRLSFNLTTGQPATEADYEAFIKLVS